MVPTLRFIVSNLRRARVCLGVAALALATAAHPANAQTPGFFNTDPGRPLKVEDASAVPRFALDHYVASDWQNGSGDSPSAWFIRPGLLFGLVPRTQVEVDATVALKRSATDADAGLAGLRAAAQYTLNLERGILPTLAFEASMAFPVGDAESAHSSVKTLATKTFHWGRLHVNSEALFGDEPVTSPARLGLSRWQTGVAADRAFTRRGLLAGAEVVARQTLDPESSVQWSVGGGVSQQLTPSMTIDFAGALTFARSSRTFNVSIAFSRQVPFGAVMPGAGRWGRF